MNKSAVQNLLNHSQRSSVAVALRRVEWTLRSALRELESRDRGTLFWRSATLSEGELQEMKPHIEQALAEIDILARELDLPAQVVDNRRTLMGQLSILWSDLEDSHAHALKRYGDVTPDLAGMLDPHLDQLIEDVNTLLGIMSDEPDPEDNNGHKA